MGLEEDFKITEAPIQSLDDFILLLEQVGEWLWEKGIKQWAPGSFHKDRAKLEHRVENGCLILAYQSVKLAGGCILSAVNPGWPESSGEEMYLSSLAVARFAAGRGLGTRILDACTEATRKRGKRFIRLDCWDGNDFLKSFYQQEGFKMLEAVAVQDYFVRPFEKDIGVRKEIQMTRVGSDVESHETSTGHCFSSPDWLDNHYIAMQPEYEEQLRWVGLEPGWHVLDAGCGSGSFLPLLTELVGSDGQVSAIDLAPESIKTVQKRAEQSGWPAPVSARVGPVHDLPYEDDSFDAVWCANTTIYLTDDQVRAALAEFRRVTRPGGLIAIKAYDGTTEQFQPSTPTLFIHAMEERCRYGSQVDCGLLRVIELPKWLREAGLVDLRQKATLIVRFQPLDPATKQLVAGFLQGIHHQNQQLGVELSEEEARLWQKLADTDSPDHILHHPDFQYRVIESMFVARVPD